MEYYANTEVRRIWILEIHSFPDGWEIKSAQKNIVILNTKNNLQNGKSLAGYLGGERNGVYLYEGTKTKPSGVHKLCKN